MGRVNFGSTEVVDGVWVPIIQFKVEGKPAVVFTSIVTTQRYANKFGRQPVAAALELVRGGKLVANDENEFTETTHEDSLKKGVSV